MLKQAIQKSKSKIDAFADLANDYLRLRMDYAMLQEPKLTFDESKNSENMQLILAYAFKRQTKEIQLKECAKNLTDAFNNAIMTFCEGLQDEKLVDYSAEIIDNLQVIFMRFNRMANIDAFKGILYIEDDNKPILKEISNKLATYTDKIQIIQLKCQIDALLCLEKI